jgi:hypothetical protein
MKPVSDTDQSSAEHLEHSGQPSQLSKAEAATAIRQSPAYATCFSALALIGIGVLRKNAKLG